ncbi:MAG: hypothetical protein IJE97_05580, partial [Thermoguttaceae bacterium]|nr:hypothetical protein [Thermoguttaceae bacterium]
PHLTQPSQPPSLPTDNPGDLRKVCRHFDNAKRALELESSNARDVNSTVAPIRPSEINATPTLYLNHASFPN